MKIVRCDNHPDREAVVTLSIKTLPLGSRPMVLGFEIASQRFIFDLCSECKNQISSLIEEDG